MSNNKPIKGDFIYSTESDKKYAPVDNLNDYIALPISQRTRWGFWYKEPSSYLVGGGDFDSFWKKHYPLQYRLREFISDVRIWFIINKRRFYENIICRLRPQNKWARHAIPHTWSDKMSLIEDFLFAAIVDFVERENENSIVDWEAEPKHSDAWKRINRVYTFIKVDLPLLQEKEAQYLDKMYDKDGKVDSTKSIMNWFSEKKESNKKMRLGYSMACEETDRQIQKNLKEIIELRPYLWT
tara:strand:+ start:31580 stop:32299 length:720 start_codon:yes stop_codon:yes gene_type:complete